MTETLPSEANLPVIEAEQQEAAIQQESEAQEEPVALTGDALLRALEALLFVACEPLTVQDLAKYTEADDEQVGEALKELTERYADRGFTLRRIAGGYQFVTPEQFAFLVERLYRPKYQQLSSAALEALAVIAYKQPITRAEVAAVRQVDSDSVINTLLEKKLIREVGRVNTAGRAILYGTGEEFLSFFGIDSLDDLPRLQEEEQGEFNL
ncbi:MAG: SMC-Scp complex subunit ScpB [Firmicutes bacterium]|nr:SMC-Scp complex subunit ScpB [Bacillota bacterium]